MTANYRIDLLTPAGVKVAEIDTYSDLAYSNKLNAPGVARFTLNLSDSKVASKAALLQDKAIVEIYRQQPDYGIAFYKDFTGLYRAQRRVVNEDRRLVVTCPGVMDLLRWRHVGYSAGVANFTKFTSAKAETIMKRLVDYNAGSNATLANGRVRTPNSLGITIQTDAAGGNTIDYACAWKNLLTALQDLAWIGGGDFDLVRTTGATYQFRFYSGQRGTDRSSTLKFAVDLGNITNVEYEYNRIEEATVAIVGGQDQGVNRQVLYRTSSRYSTTNDIETFVDGRGNDTTAGLQATGDNELYQNNKGPAGEKFSFKVLQVAGCLLGRDYFLGDIGIARDDTIQQTIKISGYTIQMSNDGTEDVQVEVRNNA